ncbi:MAG: hypothetical protein HRT94_05770 [Alphaproteobacteria bacterium]|nr:hypothetical protein [Alphaproteobacteria bacterium]
MGYQPIARTVPQYVGTGGKPYSGAVLKAYKADSTINIAIASDNTGAATANSVALNASGFPEMSGNVIIPHLDQAYKLSLYPSQSAADSDTGALWMIDNLSVGLSFGEKDIEIDSDTVLTQAAHANAHLEITGLTTLTMPPLATVANAMIFTYRNAGTEDVTFDGDAAELINGSETVIIKAGASGMFVAGSDEWYATGVNDVQLSNIIEVLNYGVPETGDTCYSWRTSKTGWVLASGRTIGNAASGATERANADTLALFTILWDSQDNTLLPIEDSSGVATTRGASALDDFNANKRLPLPDERGRVAAGLDDMGGSAAGRMSLSRPEGVDGTVLGNAGGEQDHVQTEAELVPHTHQMGRGTNFDYTSNNQAAKGTGTNYTTTSTGGGEAMNNVQPTIMKNVFIKL